MSRPTNPPTDDPATLRARLEKRYERPERPCTYDPADEEPEAEPVSRVDIEHRWTNPEAPPLDRTAREANVIAEPIGWPKMDTTEPDTVSGSFTCLCGAVLHWSGPHNGARGLNEDGTPHACPTVERPITDTTDPEWVRQIHGAPPGQLVRLLAAGSADDYTAEMAEHRATLYRASGYTDVSVSVFRPEPQPHREECPACGEYGWHDSRCDLDSYHLRSYLRTLTNPDATPDEVGAALDLLTDEDRELVATAIPSWGTARMARAEAVAPFMARFETMVRERDPRANEEGTLLLSALLEDDPTRSTIEALMDIAKTPKVNP